MRFERPLLAYDGSDEADAAVPLALRIASGAELTLAHVVEVPDPLPELAGAGAEFERAFQQAREDWERRLGALDPHDAAHPVAIEVRIAPRAAGALIEIAREREADLLVAGTAGVGGIKRFLGSVSQQLLDHAPCSVLLVRRGRRASDAPVILAAIDGSDATRGVLQAAEGLATSFGAKLVLVHAVDPNLPVASMSATHDLRDWVCEQGERVLHDAHATISAPLETVIEDLRVGSVDRELASACEEHAPTIAVVGSRGLHGFRGLLLGSNARHFVNHASCPVLVVRQDAGDG